MTILLPQFIDTFVAMTTNIEWHTGGTPTASVSGVTQLWPRLLIWGALLGWCAGLLLLRYLHARSISYVFLPWNLFLAWIPACAAFMARRTPSDEWSFGRVGALVVWLLFLPNAPYLVTDFIHLDPRPPVPLWYDVALLTSAAATGLFFAFTSVADVHAFVPRRHGRIAAWSTAVIALMLSGFGVYLGRFLRWNSWDVVARPGTLAADILNRIIEPQAHVKTFAVTLIYGAGLVLGYCALRAFARIAKQDA